jgi:biotin transport system substrate-specific component
LKIKARNKKKMSVRGVVLSAMFAALTAAGAFIAIPIGPVPITVQTLFVHLSGALLGSRLGALAQFIYLLVGVIGLPVFARGGSGLGHLLGPTGGYVIGFIIGGGYLTGKLAELKQNPGPVWIAGSCLVGLVVIYMLGVIQLALVSGRSLAEAYTVGVAPFLIGDALKIMAAVFIAHKLKGMIRL